MLGSSCHAQNILRAWTVIWRGNLQRGRLSRGEVGVEVIVVANLTNRCRELDAPVTRSSHVCKRASPTSYTTFFDRPLSGWQKAGAFEGVKFPHTFARTKTTLMQTHSFLARAILASVGLVFAAETHAALNYNEGDLLMSFRATGGAGVDKNYLVNLGPKEQFLNATSVLTLDTELGNLNADLEFYFSSTFEQRVDFLWSITGSHLSDSGPFVATTMFVTRRRSGTATLGVSGSTAWPNMSLFASGSPSGAIVQLGNRYEQGNIAPGAIESTNSAFALIQPASDPQSYNTFMPNGTTRTTAFSFFAGTGTIEAPVGAGLDLYHITPGAGGNSTFEGSFAIDGNGTVTFTPTGVPEPSSFLALGAGLVVLTNIRRRKAIR